MARDTRLPLSGTSTHLSVSPKKLTLNNAPVVSGSNTATQNISYDGSTAYTIDLSKISAAYASAWSSAKGGISQPIYFDSNGAAQIATDVFAKSIGGTVTAETTFNANVHLRSSTDADSLSAGSLIVSGNTSLVNTTNTSNVYPHAHRTYNLGSSALEYNEIHAKEFHGALKGNADTASKSATQSVGSTTKPIYIDSNGNWTATNANIGTSSKPIFMNAGELTAVSGNFGGPNSSNNRYTLMHIAAGTFTTASTTVGSDTIPVYVNAGVITPITSLNDSVVAGKAAKWSGGAKGDENHAIYLDTDGVPQTTNAMFLLAGNNTATGINTFNGNATFNSSVSIDSLSAGSLIVNDNTSLVNTTSTSSILPHSNNTSDIGSNALKYKEVYAANFRGIADSATKLTAGYGSSSKPVYIKSDGYPEAISSLDMGSAAIKTTGTATLGTISNTTATIKNLTVASSGSFNYAPIPNFSANATYYPWFSQSGDNIGKPGYHTGLSYNPGTGTLTATKFSGSFSGTATSANQFSSNKTVSISGAVSGTASSNFATDSNALSISVVYAGTVPVNKGGTNITSYTKGDILYASDTTTISKLALTTTANAILVADTTNKAPVWRTNVTVSTSAMTLTNTTLSVGSSVDTQGTTDANAAVVVSGGASIAKTVSAKEMQVADHVNLHYDAATDSLQFIFA